MIPRLTFILSLMFVAVAAAGLFGHDRIRSSGKDTAAKEVATAEAAAPAAPIFLRRSHRRRPRLKPRPRPPRPSRQRG